MNQQQKKSSTWIIFAAIGGVVLLLCLAVAVGVGIMVKSSMDDARRQAAELEAAQARQEQELGAIDDGLIKDLELLVAMQEGIKKREALEATRAPTPEQFKDFTATQLIELVMYDLLPNKDFDQEALMDKPIEERVIEDTITAPAGHYIAGTFEKKPRTSTSPVTPSMLGFSTFSLLEPIITSTPAPESCAIDDAQNSWLLQKFDCRLRVINTLSTLHMDKNLYISEAMLNPEAITQLTDTFLALASDTPLFESDRTLAEFYRQLHGAVPDYLQAHAFIAEYGEQRALAEYRKELKKAARDDDHDMRDFYEAFGAKSDRNVDANAVGFWLRRMDDRTAPIIMNFLMKSEEKFGKK